MRIRVRHYATQLPVEIVRENGCIVEIAPLVENGDDPPFIAPALFDLQINGAFGHSFNSPDLSVEHIRAVVDLCRLHGIAALLPTLVTQAHESIVHGFRTLTLARNDDAFIRRAVPGYHLEGPYISADDGPRGAHPREHVRKPNWDEFRRFQDAADGLIKLVTLAPEHDGATDFIERLTRAGVVVALGHTAANAGQIRDAIAAGAKLSTHLGNGAHAVLPRHDNYIWEQLAADDLWASVIPDGHHLPASVLKSIVRGKSPDRLVITCDASSLAGLPPGRYPQWGTEFEVMEDGRIVVPGTPFLAGSGMFTDECLLPMMQATGLSLAAVIDMATAQPRRLLRLEDGGLAVGSAAPLMLFRLRESKFVVESLLD